MTEPPTQAMREAVLAALTDSQWFRLHVEPECLDVSRMSDANPTYLKGRSCDIQLRVELTDALWEQFAPPASFPQETPQ